jgi:hypothetical protein
MAVDIIIYIKKLIIFHNWFYIILYFKKKYY